MGSAWEMAAALAVDRAWAWAVVAARVLGMAATAPAWGSAAVGWRLRLVLVGAITLVMAPAVAGPMPVRPGDPFECGRVVAVELALGAALGLASAMVIAGARQAGELVGSQAGLSPASLFDPEAGGDLNPMGHLHGLVALGTFLALDGPLAVVGAIVESYRTLPAGLAAPPSEMIELTFGRVGAALALAVRAAAPVAVAMVLAGLALGLLGRAAPSLQAASLAMLARVGIGLLLALLGLAGAVATFAAAWLF